MPRFENIYEYPSSLEGHGLSVGVVMSRFNQDICEGLLSACTVELRRLGVSESDIEIATVPGALEIPLVLQNMAQSDRFDALIALGAVIRGETYHFEIVADTSAAEIARVSRENDIPIANGILTTYDDEQCKARTHMKGKDCARCAVEMANLAKEFVSAEDFDDEENRVE